MTEANLFYIFYLNWRTQSTLSFLSSLFSPFLLPSYSFSSLSFSPLSLSLLSSLPFIADISLIPIPFLFSFPSLNFIHILSLPSTFSFSILLLSSYLSIHISSLPISCIKRPSINRSPSPIVSRILSAIRQLLLNPHPFRVNTFICNEHQGTFITLQFFHFKFPYFSFLTAMLLLSVRLHCLTS